MPQCENHETFAEVALGYGWKLYDHGIDSTCIVGGDAPHKALIWLRPLAWDESQLIPVGCVCCTDLNAALLEYSDEFFGVVDNNRALRHLDPASEIRLESNDTPPLAECPAWLKPYQAY